jgi:hypothetical protein
MSDFPRIFTVELAAVARSPGRSLAVARRVLPLESLTHAILLCALARRASSASRPTGWRRNKSSNKICYSEVNVRTAMLLLGCHLSVFLSVQLIVMCASLGIKKGTG